MRGAARYLRLYIALGRYGLARELAFRGNFLVKLFVEILWLGILLAFYHLIFGKTSSVAGWSQEKYLFFVGCYFTMGGLIETLFLSNCSEFSDLIRSGDLDFFLLKPIDEQFLVTCRSIDWSSMANVVMGSAVMGIALHQMPQAIGAGQVLLFLILFGCGVAMAYSFLLVLTSMAVWFTRNQSMYELWWLFTSLMRYPKELFGQSWAWPVGMFFTYVVPILLVVNVPADVLVRAMEPNMVVFMGAVTLVLVVSSRMFFRAALRRYRSASS